MKWLLILIVISILPACGGKGGSTEQEGELEFEPEWDYEEPIVTPTPTPTPVACTAIGTTNQTIEISGAFLNNNVVPANLTVTIHRTADAGTISQSVHVASNYQSGLMFSPSTKKVSLNFTADGVKSYTVTVSASGIPTLTSATVNVTKANGCHPDAHLVQFTY